MKEFEFSEQQMKTLGIAGIFLFGSQAQGTANEASDFDFGVLLNEPRVLQDYKKKHNLYDALYDLFSAQIQKLTDIDIVFLQSTDLQLQYHVVSQGKLIYIADQKIVGEFMERTMDMYADFAPLRAQFHAAILARV